VLCRDPIAPGEAMLTGFDEKNRPRREHERCNTELVIADVVETDDLDPTLDLISDLVAWG
jgi:hypothetical protein